LGTLRAASAITIALSPASTRSITMIASSADMNSGENNSMLLQLPLKKVAFCTLKAYASAQPDPSGPTKVSLATLRLPAGPGHLSVLTTMPRVNVSHPQATPPGEDAPYRYSHNVL